MLWLALLTPLCVWLANHVQARHSGTDFGTGMFLFVMGVVVWLIAGLWWMLARAEVIRVVEIKRDKQYARRKLAREQAQAQAQEQSQNA